MHTLFYSTERNNTLRMCNLKLQERKLAHHYCSSGDKSKPPVGKNGIGLEERVFFSRLF